MGVTSRAATTWTRFRFSAAFTISSAQGSIPSPWITRTRARLRSFMLLLVGWNSWGSVPSGIRVVTATLSPPMASVISFMA